MGKLYTRAGRSRHNAVCHSGGAENNNNLYWIHRNMRVLSCV
jgi:hypothetical protein